MNKEDYLRKKGILPKQNMGKIYTFTSDRNGVSEISEHVIFDITLYGKRCQPLPEVPIHKYVIKEAPYEINIADDETYGSENHLFSGFGDCWNGATFGSLDIKLLETLRYEELERIQTKYLNKS